jgi:hypothetical protein
MRYTTRLALWSTAQEQSRLQQQPVSTSSTQHSAGRQRAPGWSN